MICYLYAIVRKRDAQVLYAGVTRHPHKRHRLNKKIGMMILRSCPIDRAYRIEKQIIAAYQKRNKCKGNFKRKMQTRTQARIESDRRKRLIERGLAPQCKPTYAGHLRYNVKSQMLHSGRVWLVVDLRARKWNYVGALFVWGPTEKMDEAEQKCAELNALHLCN